MDEDMDTLESIENVPPNTVRKRKVQCPPNQENDVSIELPPTVEKRSRGRTKSKPRGTINGGRKKIIDTVNAACSDRTKRRRAQEHLDIVQDPDVRKHMLRILLKEELEKNVVQPNNADDNRALKRHTPESALHFFLKGRFSKRVYEMLVADAGARGARLYPCYKIIAEAKIRCLPLGIIYLELEVIVPLQNLLNHTAERLYEVFAAETGDAQFFNFYGALGFDSSSNHLNAQQKTQDPKNKDDASSKTLFVSNLVYQSLEDTTGDWHWTNPAPQSIHSCRAIRLAYEKEDVATIKAELARLVKEIDNLKDHSFFFKGKEITFHFIVAKTLFDGKCINAIVDNHASQRCSLCRCMYHEFSNVNSNFEIAEEDQENLELGLGLLHTEIKCMENLVNMSYRMYLQPISWEVPQLIKKEQMIPRKTVVQDKIFDAIGVRVDMVKQGKGTTNTGNVARRCFANPDKFAEVLELDVQLVRDIALMLKVYKSKQHLNIEAVMAFSERICDRYRELYPWARMNPTMHKFLRHGWDIAARLPLPIAQYSEDGSESWHKEHRRNAIEHARQDSHLNRITDMFNRAMYDSDPVIAFLNFNGVESQPITDEMKPFLELADPANKS